MIIKIIGTWIQEKWCGLKFFTVNRMVPVSNQPIELHAIMFLYNKFLERPLDDAGAFKRTK